MNGIDARIYELAEKCQGFDKFDYRKFAEELLIMAANQIEVWDHGVFPNDHNGIRLLQNFGVPYKVVRGDVK